MGTEGVLPGMPPDDPMKEMAESAFVAVIPDRRGGHLVQVRWERYGPDDDENVWFTCHAELIRRAAIVVHREDGSAEKLRRQHERWKARAVKAEAECHYGMEGEGRAGYVAGIIAGREQALCVLGLSNLLESEVWDEG